MSKQLRFEGRIAIVTGAGSGLGRSHAMLLASRGATVVVNELPKTIDRAKAVVAEIEKAGGRAVAIGAQVGVDADARGLVEQTIKQFERIDIIVNNAGIPGGGASDVLVTDSPTDKYERMLDVHVRGPLQINRAAWPHMVKQQYGRILFTGSANGTGWMRCAHGYESDYASAKAAVFAIARQTAGAGADHNIMANTLMPWAYSRAVEEMIGGSDLGNWMQTNLRADQASKGILFLLHENCPCSGEAISSQGGRVARVFFGATTGYFNPNLEPEDAFAHWEIVRGKVNADGLLLDTFEQSEPREEGVIGEMLKLGHLPNLKWISDLPVDLPRLASGKK